MGRVTKQMYTLDRVGSDVEVFLRSAKDATPQIVCGLVGGSKLKPKPIPELGEGFMIQEDNVMPEYNIPAAATSDELVGHISRMNDYLDSLFKPMSLLVDKSASMRFKPDQLKSRQAQEVGCEPDFNVWLRRPNPSPKANPEMATLRTAGGHVHVSFLVNDKPPSDIFQREPVVKALDYTLGLPSLFLDPDQERRILYGKVGAFRPKDYGIEYRVLSNFWTKTPESVRWVFDGVQRALYLASNYSNAIDAYEEYLQVAFSGDKSNWERYARYCLSLMGLSKRAGIRPEAGTLSPIDWEGFAA